MQYLVGLLDGSIVPKRAEKLTLQIAVQIYELIFHSGSCEPLPPPQLYEGDQAARVRKFYFLLATLALGEPTAAPDSRKSGQLMDAMKKAPNGKYHLYKEAIKYRFKDGVYADPELAAIEKPRDAMDVLLRRYGATPFAGL